MQSFLDNDIVYSIEINTDCYDVINMFRRIYSTCVANSVQPYLGLLWSWAVYYDHQSLLQFLLSSEEFAGSFVHSNNPSALHIAIVQNNVAATLKLLNAGFDVHSYSSVYVRYFNDKIVINAWPSSAPWICKKLSAFELAMVCDNWHMVTLMKNKFQLHKSRNGQSLLHLACKFGAIKCLQELINISSCDDVNARDNEGKIPLMLSFEHPITIMELLLPRSDVSCTTFTEGANCIHLLLSSQQNAINESRLLPTDVIDKLNMLINAGCNVRAKCRKTQWSVLHYIARQVDCVCCMRTRTNTVDEVLSALPTYRELMSKLVSKLFDMNIDETEYTSSFSLLLDHIFVSILVIQEVQYYTSHSHEYYVHCVREAILLGKLLLSKYYQGSKKCLTDLNCCEKVKNVVENCVKVVIQSIQISNDDTSLFLKFHDCVQELISEFIRFKTLSSNETELVLLLVLELYQNILVKAISAFGQNFANKLYDNIEAVCIRYQVTSNIPLLKKKVFYLCRTPMTLKNCCRHVIYTVLKKLDEQTVNNLPVPLILQNFIKFM